MELFLGNTALCLVLMKSQLMTIVVQYIGKSNAHPMLYTRHLLGTRAVMIQAVRSAM